MSAGALRVPARASALAGVLLFAATGRADMTKQQCIDANARGQDLMHDGKLTAAHDALQACAAPTCPPLLRRDCAKRLDQLERVQPSIVFTAQDAAGNDLGEVAVTMDGAALAGRLAGTPLRVDPGEHTFVFTAPGQAAVTKTLVIAERDQARRERVVFPGEAPAPGTPSGSSAAPSPAPITSAPPSSAPATAPRDGMRPLRVAGIVTASVGLVGLGVGSAFGLLTGSAWNAQKSDCPSSQDCPRHAQAVSEHATLTTDSTLSTVSFAAGGALLVAGVTMVALGGHRGEASPTTALVVAPSFGPWGGGLSVAGAF